MTRSFYVVLGSLSVFLLAQTAAASMIVYESLPTSNSPHVSVHQAGGPVLADDFMSAFNGRIKGIEWWGAAPLAGTDQWEVTFHSDAGGTPAATAPFGGIAQHFVSATGTDLDGDGIFHYTADWSPADIFILANTSYWFSVANASGNGWTWANGALPTIGAEFFNAMVSSGAPGSPHFGPWTGIDDTDFAFRIIVPEPAIVGLFGLGLLGAGFAGRRRQRS